MGKTINVALDAMGGDNAPGEIVKGALDALETENVNITLVGAQEAIQRELKRFSYDKTRVSIVNASEVINMDYTPTTAIKQKKDSSMIVGLKLLKEEKAHAFISAGNTGALLSGATIVVGRIKGVERPALAVHLPTERGFSLLIDCGANTDAKPSYIVQFAKMGSIYMETVLNVKNPKIALANIGTEKEKGNLLTKEAFNLLSSTDINFIGNIEASNIPEGNADVIVCDAFTGNIILKYTEGLALTIFAMIKRELMATTISRIGAMMTRSRFVSLKKRFSSEEVGGAPFLGLTGIVVKVHGGSGAQAVKASVKQCAAFVANGFIKKLELQI